jgi:hypothetical protein
VGWENTAEALVKDPVSKAATMNQLTSNGMVP